MLGPSGFHPVNQGSTCDIPQDMLTRLVAVLEEMVTAYQQLLTLLQIEKNLIIEGDIESLVPCFDEKEERLRYLNVLESKRCEVMGLIARQIAVGQRPLRLKQLLSKVKGPCHNQLRSCQVRLEALMASIAEINQINGLLVERVLGQITNLVGLLRHMATVFPTYDPSGLLRDHLSSGRTITKG